MADPASSDRPAPEVVVHPREAGRWLFLSDLLALAAVLLLTFQLHPLFGFMEGISAGSHAAHAGLAICFNVLLLIWIGLDHQYEERHRFRPIDDTVGILRGALLAASLATFLDLMTDGYWFDVNSWSRSLILLYTVPPVVLLLAGRAWAFHRQSQAMRAGRFRARALVVGDGDRADDFCAWLRGQRALDTMPTRSSVSLDLEPAAFEAELLAELERLRPDEVVLAFDQAIPAKHAAAVRQAAFHGVPVKVLPGVFEEFNSAWSSFDGEPVTELFATRGMRFGRQFKGVVDRACALLGLLLLSPVLLLIALLIWLEDRGPALYSQPRIGYRGREFRFWKFRTMRVDGDALLAQRLAEDAEARRHWDEFQKLEDDTRITRIGRVLRRTSIDELPQLINVLFGEMSLVGPRPPLPDQVEDFGDAFVFSQALPGITGMWQVSGRNKIDFQGRVNLDAWYAENWTPMLDLRILLRTFGAVVRRSGAY